MVNIGDYIHARVRFSNATTFCMLACACFESQNPSFVRGGNARLWNEVDNMFFDLRILF